MKKIYFSLCMSLVISFSYVQFASAATITGKVVYEGEAPKFREIKMDSDPVCLTKHTDAVFPETLVLGEGQSVGNVFVHITKGLTKKDYPAPAEEVVITQMGCMYSPHVLGLMVNQSLKIMNPDGTLHNVHASPKINKEFNIAMPKFRKEITTTFEKPEFMFPVKCDVHPWMGAWISVMDNPFFSVTKEDGLFKIENLPAGEYEIQAWHEKLKTAPIQVTIAEGDAKEINFTFSKP